jgi:hypothetical protein
MPNDKPHTFDLKDPASASALRASMGRALKPRPKAGEVLGPDGKPVAAVEMKELKPYELEPGEKVIGDYWDTIERIETPQACLVFQNEDRADNMNFVLPRLPCAAVAPDGSVRLGINPDQADGVVASWKTLTGQLAEILKTARANYGEAWGK